MAEVAQNLGGPVSYPFQYPTTVSASDVAAALLGNNVPPPEGVVGTPGTMPVASRNDHAHERLTSTHPTLALDATGKRSVLYSRTFDREPAVIPVAKTPASGVQAPTLTYEHVFNVVNGKNVYTGCIITGVRPGPVVQVLGLSVLSASVPAANAEFNVVAIATSQPA